MVCERRQHPEGVSKPRVAEGERICYNDTKGMSVVFRIASHPRVEKLVAHAWFKAGYTTAHPGFFESWSRVVFPKSLVHAGE